MPKSNGMILSKCPPNHPKNFTKIHPTLFDLSCSHKNKPTNWGTYIISIAQATDQLKAEQFLRQWVNSEKVEH